MSSCLGALIHILPLQDILVCHTKNALMRLPTSFLLFPVTFALFLLCFPVPRTYYWTAYVIFLLLSRSTLHPCPLCPPSQVADLCGLRQHANLPSGFQLAWPVVSPMGILKRREGSLDVYFPSFLPTGCHWSGSALWVTAPLKKPCPYYAFF